MIYHLGTEPQEFHHCFMIEAGEKAFIEIY